MSLSVAARLALATVGLANALSVTTGAGRWPYDGASDGALSEAPASAAGGQPYDGASGIDPDGALASGAGGQPYDGASGIVASGAPDFGAGGQPYEGAAGTVASGAPAIGAGGLPYDGASDTVASEMPAIGAGGQPYDGASGVVASGAPDFGAGGQPYDGASDTVTSGAPDFGVAPDFGAGGQPYDGASDTVAGGAPAVGAGGQPYDGASDAVASEMPASGAGGEPHDGAPGAVAGALPAGGAGMWPRDDGASGGILSGEAPAAAVGMQPYGAASGAMPNDTSATEAGMRPDMPFKPYDGMSGIIFKRFSAPGCRGVVTDAHSMKYLDSGLFECQYGGVNYYLEFKCQHEGISVVYHTANSRSSATTGYPIWWLTEVWKTMSYGRCVDTLEGSIQYTHALPHEVAESLSDCLEAKPSTYVEWFKGKDCKGGNNPHGVYLEKRIGHDGCFDTVSKKYFRYGQTYACVDNALVESYYPDYGRCSVIDPTYSSNQYYWTYRKWRRYTGGECVNLANENSMRVTDPSMFGNVRQIIAQTQCGNPSATWNMYNDRACADHLLGQEVVTRDINGCIHLTGCNQVKKLKACKVNASFVKVFQHSVGGCVGLPEATNTITMRDFKKLRSGKCTVMRSMPPAPPRRKISFRLDLHRLPNGDPMPNPFLPLATCPDAVGEPDEMSDAESPEPDEMSDAESPAQDETSDAEGPAPASDPTPPRDAE